MQGLTRDLWLNKVSGGRSQALQCAVGLQSAYAARGMSNI